MLPNWSLWGRTIFKNRGWILQTFEVSHSRDRIRDFHAKAQRRKEEKFRRGVSEQEDVDPKSG
jgi:hypothetical protein